MPNVSLELSSAFCARAASRSAQVGVIGLGYVGLPLGLLFARNGLPTTGFDIDPAKVEMLGKGESYIRHIPASAIAEQVRKGGFRATTDFARLEEMDAILICVPTPLDAASRAGPFLRAQHGEAIAPHLRRGQLVVLESTTYPGTTEEVVLPILEKSGLNCPILPYATDGSRISTPSWNPRATSWWHFPRSGKIPETSSSRPTRSPKSSAGVNAASALAAQALYGQAFEKTLVVSSTRTAEMTKILENTYRCVNIALVNELKLLCLRMGIDIWEVIEAARTKPFGFTPFFPGPGLGGHCIPIDPFYLTWKAHEYEFPNPLH